MYRDNRRANVLRLAALAGLYHNTEGDKGGGGGDPKPEPKDKGKGKDKPADEPEKLTLTQAELDAKIEDRLAAERRKGEEAARKKKEEEDAAKELERGEHQKVIDRLKIDNGNLKAENRELRLERDLSRHLLDKHPDYVKCAQWIRGGIPADTKDEELPKAIEKAAADYVNDNPRADKGGTGGALPKAGQGQRPTERDKGQGNQQGRTNGNQPQRREPSVAASRL